MPFPLRRLLPVALLLSACVAPREGAEDTWAHRASDFVSPLVPEALKPGPREPDLKATVRVEPAEFAVAERREVRVIFTIQNTTKRPERLEFPTSQRIELTVRAPDGKKIFLWSEDRLFEAKPAIVVINPRERIEYDAAVPTRDMKAGEAHAAEVVLVGRPEIAAVVQIKPL
ncbi:MAG: hypothetical protein IAE97_04645 [Chthoniobacterales bacterium]|nr:hypothetical protein [Chthoniobacterales bacterium]